VAKSWSSRSIVSAGGLVVMLGAVLGACGSDGAASRTPPSAAKPGPSSSARPAAAANQVAGGETSESRSSGGESEPANGGSSHAPPGGTAPASSTGVVKSKPGNSAGDSPTAGSQPPAPQPPGESTPAAALARTGPAFSSSQLAAIDQQLGQLTSTLNGAKADLDNPQGDN
jgi:hypothetical protein